MPSLLHSQHGVHPDWSENISLPHPLSGMNTRGYLYSNMAVFSDGQRVIFLQKTDPPAMGAYVSRSRDGMHWDDAERFQPQDLVIGGGDFKIITDRNDRLHILWSSKIPEALYYTQMDADLNVVGPDTIRISDHPEYGTYSAPYITVDRNNRIHVMWHEGDHDSVASDCFYSRSDDRGLHWTSKKQISREDQHASAFPRGQFDACRGDTLAIAWRDHSSTSPDYWNIHLTVSTDAGEHWSDPITVNGGPYNQFDPDVVVDPFNRIHLFFDEAPQGDVFYGKRIVYGYTDDLGQHWLPFDDLSKNIISRDEKSYLTAGSRYDAEQNVLWTSWKEEDLPAQQGGDLVVCYSLDRGISWSDPEYVTDRGEISIGFKATALLPGGGMAVNYELPMDSSNGGSTVYYKERSPIATTSTNRFRSEPEVTLFPSPVDDHLNIHIQDVAIQQIIILNSAGQLIHQISPETTKFEIDFTGYRPGLYFIALTTNDYSLVKKVIKQ